MLERPSHCRAFTMIELVIVVVIIGIIAAIAVPRMSNAAQNSQEAALRANLRVLTAAAELYAAEHNGLTPAQSPDGSVDSDPAAFLKRLFTKTSVDGNSSGAVIYGPYLRQMPANPLNSLVSIRVDGAAAGINSTAYRYDSSLRIFQADDSVASAALLPDAVGP